MDPQTLLSYSQYHGRRLDGNTVASWSRLSSCSESRRIDTSTSRYSVQRISGCHSCGFPPCLRLEDRRELLNVCQIDGSSAKGGRRLRVINLLETNKEPPDSHTLTLRLPLSPKAHPVLPQPVISLNMSRLVQPSWWREAVIYEVRVRLCVALSSNTRLSSGNFIQISPATFKSSKGGEVGDLEGVRRKLDYIVSLGVTAIWVCPFFKR